MGIPLSLLLLEDSLPDAELIVRELRRAGYEPRETRVTNEEEFDAGLAAGIPQVILADSSLPLFSMSRALDRLRERGLNIPVIVVTGARGYEKAEECINLGAAGYVLKDDLSRLPKVIEQAITKKPV